MKHLKILLLITFLVLSSAKIFSQVYKHADGKAETVTQLSLKLREASFIRDTVNAFWIGFCKDYNNLFKSKSMGYTSAPNELRYDTSEHIIYAYYTKGWGNKKFFNGYVKLAALQFDNIEIQNDKYHDDIRLSFNKHGECIKTGSSEGSLYIMDDHIDIKSNSDKYSEKNNFDFSSQLLPKIQIYFNQLENLGFKDYFITFSSK
jgi:hypothetical protein